MTYKLVKLKEVLEQYNEKIDVIDDVEYKQVTVSKTGNITLRKLEYGAKIGTKKQNIIKSGWFIYSRLGVHDGAFGIVPDFLDGALTTGDMPVFKIRNNIIPKFLIIALNDKNFLFQLSQLTKGGAQVRIRENIFLELEIPLPTLEEQEKIVKKLESINGKIEKVKLEKIKNSSLLPLAFSQYLNDIFEGYNSYPINEVCKIGRGKSKHRPRNAEFLFGGNYPFIQTGDVRNSEKYITNFSQTYSEEGLKQSKLWNKGTICITIAANIGELAILGIDACFPDSIVGIEVNEKKAVNEYIYYYLKTLKSYLNSKAKESAQKNINMEILSTINIPLPPLEEQKRIVKKIEEFEEKLNKLDKLQTKQLKELEALKNAVLDKALNGELI